MTHIITTNTPNLIADPNVEFPLPDLVKQVFGELYVNGLIDTKNGKIESRCDPVALSRLLRQVHAIPH